MQIETILIFFCSLFYPEAVEFLNSLNVKMYKVASRTCLLKDPYSYNTLQKIAETTAEQKEGVVVPNAAVLSQGSSTYVMLVKNGRIEIKQVEVAEETPNYSRIIEGLKAGDQVVASYNQALENNQKVSIN